ncbi:MAG: GGDEF domain-containing protein [Nautiliaceae bacterium]
MEELIKEISQKTLEELEKAGKAPYPLYYKEVFNSIVGEKKLLEHINPKLLCLNNPNEKILTLTKNAIETIASTSQEIKKESKEIIEEVDLTDSEEVKELVFKFSSSLIDKINKMEEKIKTLESELNKAYKDLLIDPLTKAYNRKALENDLNKILEQGKDKDLDLVIAVIDLDDFKNVNDTYGHLVGDFVLIKLTDIIKHMIRSTDKIYRYGGDEFIIVFNRANLQNVKKIIEKIVQKISKTALKYKDNIIRMTVSVGIAKHKKGDTIETLIKRADEALYRTKQDSKNGFFISEE